MTPLIARLRSFLSALMRRRRLEADMEMEWRTHFDAHTDALVAAGTGVPNDRPSDPGPTIFTALQEQLGLQVDSTKEAIPILVIDSVNRPSPK